MTEEERTDPDLTVIIVNYNTAHLLDRMFADLTRSAAGLCLQIIVVDNASRDGSVELLRQRREKFELIVNERNVGFGRANNIAIPRIRSEYVLLLNTDAFVSENTLTSTLRQMRAQPEIGVLGVHLIGRDGRDQPSCRFFPTPLNIFLTRTGLAGLIPGVRMIDDAVVDRKQARECDWVPGCFYLTRRAVIQQCGLFDPRYFLYYEEVDHCKMVKSLGWKVFYTPETEVIHIGGESAKSDGTLTSSGSQLSTLLVESELLYMRKHHGLRGVSLHVVLGAVACSWLGLKTVLKALLGRDRLRDVLLPFSDLALQLRVLIATRFGHQPTR